MTWKNYSPKFCSTAEGGLDKTNRVCQSGRASKGKSTLLNSIIGHKVAIVSDKPQTTRNRIQGIYTGERGQAIFVDTPGVHKPKHRLGEYMVDITSRALREVDLILYIVDASVPPGPGEEYIMHNLMLQEPRFLVPNKIDLVDDGRVLELISNCLIK